MEFGVREIASRFALEISPPLEHEVHSEASYGSISRAVSHGAERAPARDDDFNMRGVRRISAPRCHARSLTHRLTPHVWTHLISSNQTLIDQAKTNARRMMKRGDAA